MIITNLIGGLGNQLFQYACGHAVATRHGVALRLAVDQFQGYPLHQGFELARVFGVADGIAEEAELRALLGAWCRPSLRRAMARWWPGVRLGGRACFEPPGGLQQGLLSVGPQAYLHGYWQSEHHFDGCTKSLRQQLRFATTPSAQNAHWAQRIEGCPSASVHMRRGDYVSNPKNRGIYAECSPAYYGAAMDAIRDVEPDIRFFVFSDDMVWARQALADRQGDVAFIDHNRGADSHSDMRLMSLCRHHVIANSSFSWWGAWLGERPGTITVAPQQWYLDPSKGTHVVPARWRRC